MAEKYIVKAGDNLNKIAAQYGFTDYKAANISGFGANPDLITPGTELTIGNTSPAPSTNQSLDASKIADQPNVSVPTGVVNPNLAYQIMDGSAATLTPTTTPEGKIAANEVQEGGLRAESKLALEKAAAARVDIAAFIESKSTELGIPMSLDEIKKLIEETDGLRSQINQLNTEEGTMIENTIGQGRGIPQTIIDGQQAKIQRQFAIRRNALAAELGARTATIQALQGNITLAQQTISTAVSAKIYESEQKVQDYKDLIAFNKDIIESLDTETQKLLDRQYTEAQTKLKETREDRDKVAQLMIDNPNAGITLSDSVAEAALKVSKKGGSLAARQEARLGRDGAGGLTPTQTNEGAAAVSLYDSTLQEAMAQGGTPEQAVQAAVAIAAGQGTKLDLLQQKALLDRAKALKSGAAPAAGAGSKTFQRRNARTGAIETFALTGDPLEDEIVKLKAGGILTNGDIRDILKKRGYTPQQLAGSSIGGIIPSISAYLFGN